MQLSSITGRKKGKSRKGQSFYLFGFFGPLIDILSKPVLEGWSEAVLGKWDLPQKYDDESSAISSRYILKPLFEMTHFHRWSFLTFSLRPLSFCLQRKISCFLFDHCELQLALAPLAARGIWGICGKKRRPENLRHLSKQLKLTVHTALKSTAFELIAGYQH